MAASASGNYSSRIPKNVRRCHRVLGGFQILIGLCLIGLGIADQLLIGTNLFGPILMFAAPPSTVSTSTRGSSTTTPALTAAGTASRTATATTAATTVILAATAAPATATKPAATATSAAITTLGYVAPFQIYLPSTSCIWCGFLFVVTGSICAAAGWGVNNTLCCVNAGLLFSMLSILLGAMIIVTIILLPNGLTDTNLNLLNYGIRIACAASGALECLLAFIHSICACRASCCCVPKRQPEPETKYQTDTLQREESMKAIANNNNNNIVINVVSQQPQPHQLPEHAPLNASAPFESQPAINPYAAAAPQPLPYQNVAGARNSICDQHFTGAQTFYDPNVIGSQTFPSSPAAYTQAPPYNPFVIGSQNMPDSSNAPPYGPDAIGSQNFPGSQDAQAPPPAAPWH